jgi:tetratricopeptide (TPR) repeat protein
MPVQPYDPCPCGSEKKFKWCCQKVAKYAERAEQMLEKGQLAAASQAIDEGLASDPENNWLRVMKVQVLLLNHDHDAAHTLIRRVLENQPGNRSVLLLRFQDELSHGMAEEAVSTIQEIMDATAPGKLEEIAPWVILLGRALAELHEEFPALAFLRLASASESAEAEEVSLNNIEGAPETLPWVRDIWELRSAPPDAAYRERMSNAIALASVGRWQRAASIFQSITEEDPESLTGWFNLGLCQAWLAQNEAAADSLQRYARIESNADSAVDALALAQSLLPRESAQTVDVVRIQYPIRDHSRLIQRLKDHRRFHVHMLDAREDELGEGVKDEFYLLDKDSVSDPASVTMETLPAIVGVVRTRGKQLELEFPEPSDNDPRPDIVVSAAGDTIDPNGNRSVAGTIPVSTYRTRRMWGIPSGGSLAAVRHIRQLVHEHNFRHIWPDTPMGWLGNRTAREAAHVSELKQILRASLLLNEYICEAQLIDIDFDPLRRELGLDPEPPLDGANLDIAHLPLARLRRVRPDTLSLTQLRDMFARASHFALPLAAERSAAELVKHQPAHGQFDHVFAFRSLMELAKRRADRPAAERWLAEARRFDAETGAPSGRPTWEIAEWELSYQFDQISEWGPRLARLMDRLESNKEAAQELSLVLIRAGILRLAPHPTDQNRMVMDTRILHQILAKFSAPQGSMIDLSPVGGEPGRIWTPADEVPGGESRIVLPGQDPGGKPRSKLVIPGA